MDEEDSLATEMLLLESKPSSIAPPLTTFPSERKRQRERGYGCSMLEGPSLKVIQLFLMRNMYIRNEENLAFFEFWKFYALTISTENLMLLVIFMSFWMELDTSLTLEKGTIEFLES